MSGSDLKKMLLTFPRYTTVLSRHLSYIALIVLRNFSPILKLLKGFFFKYNKRILSTAFSAPTEIITWLLFFGLLRIQIGKEEVKLSLFADDMVLLKEERRLY